MHNREAIRKYLSERISMILKNVCVSEEITNQKYAYIVIKAMFCWPK